MPQEILVIRLSQSFADQKGNPDCRRLEEGLDGDLTLYVVTLHDVVPVLMAHFGEAPDGMMILADVSIDHEPWS